MVIMVVDATGIGTNDEEEMTFDHAFQSVWVTVRKIERCGKRYSSRDTQTHFMRVSQFDRGYDSQSQSGLLEGRSSS
jgi:hypothetical protein